uniref:Uncharacterized protein n=1 Tax=Octactis speculum TaxID=3111310 RepID=A0A7S2DLP2_9STRA|mmetsp:Transcript_50233/g.68325  ORF Transcript_50233/g.68325 Transcript_50233/m.68325 type:complete len:172 (+) Transcript_50233:291-806(+)
MDATAKHVIERGNLPRNTELRFARAGGQHRRLPVPAFASASQFSNLPIGMCFGADFIPFGDEDIQGYKDSILFKEHKTAFLKTYLPWEKSRDFWAAVQDLATWVSRHLKSELAYLMVDSDPVWTNVTPSAKSLDTVEAKRLKEHTGIEFRRKLANSHVLDAKNSACSCSCS